MSDLRDIEVLVGLAGGEAEMLSAALSAASVRLVRAAATPGEYLTRAVQDPPDVGVLGFTLGGRPTLELLRAIRTGRNGVNRYLPIVMATSTVDLRVVQLALNAGAHEVIALPTNVRIVQALLSRAVFVGRPFVETATYAGPCRRRKAMTWLKPERRMVWAGYTHAAHRPHEFEERS
ncbi:MAG: response regulator [Alphaproteobacteria bacterium]|nr:response regulator [Alphaproteobacteria bacterium]